MPDNALYVYGIVKKGHNFRYYGIGIGGEHVYSLKQGNFTALVHGCGENPYLSEDIGKVKELIIAHNLILNKAMEDFDGVMPLPFNTIIKKGGSSAEDNLKKWLKENQEKLERAWNKIKDKKEYGIRIYYDNNKLIQEASSNTEIMEIEKKPERKGEGLSYLLQGKAKTKVKEAVQSRINQFKQKFYDDIKAVADDIKINVSRVNIAEEKDLLCSLSVLVDKKQINEIKQILEQKKSDGFSFQFAGPFAPYSFAEDETRY